MQEKAQPENNQQQQQPAANQQKRPSTAKKQGSYVPYQSPQGKKPAIQAKQRPVDRSEERAAKEQEELIKLQAEEKAAAMRARQKTAQYEMRIDKPNRSVYIAEIDTALPNDSPWVYAITYYPDINPLAALRKIYRFNSPFNDRMLSEYGLKPAFSVNMKTFEEYWLKHKTSLYTGQGYDWNIDPGQRVLIDMHVVTAERIKELDKKKKKPEDDRYRDANEWEIWLRKNIDINAWDDLVNMAYDDAVQINLPPAGKDPDGEPQKIIYPLDAVNPDRAKEEKYNKMYYGEDIYSNQGVTVVNSHFVFNDGYIPSKIKGFYLSVFEADYSEAKYLYYPVTHLKSNYKYIHYLYKIEKSQAGKASRSQIMTSANLVKKQGN